MDKEIKEFATQAGQALLNNKEAVNAAINFGTQILQSPFEQISGIVSDRIGHWRFTQAVNMLLKAKKHCEKNGINPTPLLPDNFIPIMEEGSKKSDETLSDMFSALLVKNLDKNTEEDCHPSYAKILAELAPLDAKILIGFTKSFAEKKISDIKIHQHKKNITEFYKVNETKTVVAFANLMRLNLCDSGGGFEETPDKTMIPSSDPIYLTNFGWNFIKTVSPLEIKGEIMSACCGKSKNKGIHVL